MSDFLTEPMTALTEDESWTFLSSVTVGRLATSVGDQPDVFPVNYVVQRRTVLIRTAEGTKLAAAAANEQVTFEADPHDGMTGWCVSASPEN
jgi:nitroimidazol reductase NimA-like FMN-containing flavoprotein (pyridoxamine 5'-phosphate oxidase superfamily)